MMGSLACAILAAPAARGQDPRPGGALRPIEYLSPPPPPFLRFGLYSAGAWNSHATTFSALPGVPNCCTEFLGNSSAGFLGGGLGEFFIDESISAEARLGYRSEGVLLHEVNFIGNAIIGNSILPAYSEHRIDARLPLIEFTPLLKYRPALFRSFDLRAGVSFGVLLSPSYRQSETLIRPQGATFSDGSLERNSYAGALPDAGTFQAGIVAGAGYTLPLSAGWDITPEAQYYFPLTPVVRELSWKVRALTLGISMRWGSSAESAPLKASPPPTAPAPYRTRFSANALYPDGRRESEAVCSMTETRYTELFPLLPYIFFPPGETDIAKTRLHVLTPDETAAFDEHRLARAPLGVYAELLNIIGRRLRLRPSARIIITGCNNTLREESEESALSARRAAAVKNYLVDVWGIPAGRIAIRARDLPEKPTRNETADGSAENRRAEIQSDDPGLLDPVRVEETELTESVPRAEFAYSAEPRTPVRDWEFRLIQRNRLLAAQSGRDSSVSILWDPRPELERMTDDSLVGVLVFGGGDSAAAALRTALPVRILSTRSRRFEMRDRRRIERFGLILFDFDKALLGGMNLRILDTVRTRIAPASMVTIAGYADRTGTGEYNKRLAEERCAAVREYFGGALRPDQIRIEAIGSDTLLFDNDMPEGRQYNRIVYITIATPME